MELRHVDEYERTLRRFVDDIIEEAQELDDAQERQIRKILDDMERDVEKSLERIKEVLKD